MRGNLVSNMEILRRDLHVSVANQLGLSPDATPPGTHRQRGTSCLQLLLRAHLPIVTVCSVSVVFVTANVATT